MTANIVLKKVPFLNSIFRTEPQIEY